MAIADERKKRGGWIWIRIRECGREVKYSFRETWFDDIFIFMLCSVKALLLHVLVQSVQVSARILQTFIICEKINQAKQHFISTWIPPLFTKKAEMCYYMLDHACLMVKGTLLIHPSTYSLARHRITCFLLTIVILPLHQTNLFLACSKLVLKIPYTELLCLPAYLLALACKSISHKRIIIIMRNHPLYGD